MSAEHPPDVPDLPGVPHVDLPGLDLSARLVGVARQVSAVADLVADIATRVRGCADVEWRSAAADLYRDEVAARAARLELLAVEVDDAADAIQVLGQAAERRAELLEATAAPVIGMLP